SISVPQPDIDARGAGIYWTHADLRIVLKLGTAGQLPGGPVLPHSIVVEDVAGNIDAAKNANLRTFMVNGAAGTFFANTRPIFYTDVPNGVAPCTCTDATATGCNNATRTCYTPNFASDARVYGGTNMTADLDYRRGGFYNWREQKWMYLLN